MRVPFWILLFLAPAGAWAQTPTIDQILSLRTVSTPRISPDGHYIAYQVQKTNWEENSFENEIWMAMLATGERYQLTSSKKSSTAPEWSPDGKLVAFLSDRDGKQQVYLISPMGGEATQLTSSESGVKSMHWSPDGKMIAYVAAADDDKARKDRKDKYGEFEVVGRDYSMSHLWVIHLPQKEGEKPKPEQVTKGEQFTVTEFSWSPDSQRIAFSAWKDPDLSSRDSADIYVLRLSDGYAKKLVDTKGPDANPMWSPDGKQIAFETANAHEFFFYTNSKIAVIPADGGEAHALTDKFDEDPRLVEWLPDGIYFSAQQKTTNHLFRLDPASMVIRQVTQTPAVHSGFSFTKDGAKLALVSMAENEYPEVYTASVSPWTTQKVTVMSDQLKPFHLAHREVIEWKSKDDTIIQGVLMKPADYDPKKKYPLLVVIHGGPTGVDVPGLTPGRNYPVEQFAAKGALILRPNYRGSAGYGERFRSLNVRNLGLGDYWDVISGVDYLIAKGMVDKDRVGAMGWSQGGYISAFITTYSDRFRAVSVGAGISDWTTYYVNTDIHPFTRQYLRATPWDDPEIYRKTSPISYIKSAQTPTLIQHGELDKRVPIPNAYELRQALEDRKVPVKMVVFKGFGHGIDKPKQQRAVMEQNYEWFSQWVWGEKPAQIAERGTQ